MGKQQGGRERGIYSQRGRQKTIQLPIWNAISFEGQSKGFQPLGDAAEAGDVALLTAASMVNDSEYFGTCWCTFSQDFKKEKKEFLACMFFGFRACSIASGRK